MKKRMKFGVLAAGALLVTTLGVNPASAADRYMSCYTTGSSGSVELNGWNATGPISSVVMKVYDEASDGHHARIRLATGAANGVDWNYFPWHSDTDGFGTYKTFNSSIPSVPNGHIGSVKLQVATFEHDTLLNYCEKWIDNPNPS
ncbi:hypothetical protein ACFVXE_36880 [Streptomyces sp. NPDC058231]|uniref:hypothetical protein n=1 Tax=Streptomyces sp. NPDC058231 TaxID=3346392 RepID=UPI0036E68F91